MVDEARLIAWLDGEVGPPEAHAIAAEVATDPALAALAARHRALGKRLRGGFAPVADEPAPAWFAQALAQAGNTAGEAKVVPLPRAARRWRGPAAWAAIAASLLLALGLGWSLRGAAGGLVAPAPGGGLQARGALATALERQLASAQAPGTPLAVRIGLTFRNRAGAVCRTWLARTLSGVACREGARWALAEIAATPHEEGAYRTAGEDPAVMARVEAMIADGPYDAAAEARLRERGWR
jgi:anti-sigma factor RsiW